VHPSKVALTGVALAAASAFYAGPAAATLKGVILQKLNVGAPPLIDLYREQHSRAPKGKKRGATALTSAGRISAEQFERVSLQEVDCWSTQ
jgi:hypothetical protein